MKPGDLVFVSAVYHNAKSMCPQFSVLFSVSEFKRLLKTFLLRVAAHYATMLICSAKT